MRLILLRHAEPVSGLDPELCTRGQEQATAAAAWLAAEELHALYASPAQRARRTADPLAEAKGLELRIERDLSEFDLESTEDYVPVEELRRRGDPRWHALVRGELFGADPAEFRRRVVAGMERIIAAHVRQTVVVATHAGVINAYVGHVLGIPTPIWFAPAYASLTRLTASRSGRRTVISLNETGHLRGLLA
ncbi:MAG: histidine phosphatase family protein [Myxococcaceae bacterium]|nr:histidine phosphatase family protein [Myxococcaceae bacterium]MCI0673929.1 histidine phosphatase family protein [Myxococcaceae bacterium]